MNHSGDAAEQIVRLSLEGMEVAARITGTAAKEIALFLMAALKANDKNLKPKGRARMTSMLKSGKALEIFSVKESDLKQFMQGAKQYGIVYCVLRNRKNTPDGLCDILVKADDAPKISRVAERFKFATVDKAKIESEISKAREEKAQDDSGQPPPDKNDTEKLLNELLGHSAEGIGDSEKAVNSESLSTTPNPTLAKTESPPLSAPTSENRKKAAEGDITNRMPSVRGELREIASARKAQQEAEAPTQDSKVIALKPTKNASTAHKQPPRGGSPKPKKSKERT